MTPVVIDEKPNRFAWLRPAEFLGRAALLTGFALACSLPVGLIAYWWGGANTAVAALAAAGICWLGAFLALIPAALLDGPHNAFNGFLLGMFVRMGIPLCAALAIRLHGGWLADAGTLPFLVLFYLLVLAVETIALLPNLDAAPGALAKRNRKPSAKVL